MVTAGVYLIARMHPLFEDAPSAADVGVVIGCLTLIMAATIALTQTDIKRVIAYSTMSQIGYIIMAISAAAYAAGMFHLYTHAFFKALLFMAAGSIIGAMGGEQSLDRMGGFRRALPFTFACFLAGGLALSAFPGFSGYFSKDDMLALIGGQGGWHWALYVLGYLGGFLTALYTFRMIFRAFLGPECVEARQLRRPPAPPRLPVQSGHRRGGGLRCRLPRSRPLHRRAQLAHEAGDGHAGDRRGLQRSYPDPVRGRTGQRRDAAHV
jgi:NADH-quinone oxidoreductase subunit L